MATQRGRPAMASGSQPLPDEQMRRTWALVDILTSLKRRANQPPPTAELIRRKFDTLPMAALDTLSILVDHTIAEQHGRQRAARERTSMGTTHSGRVRVRSAHTSREQDTWRRRGNFMLGP